MPYSKYIPDEIADVKKCRIITYIYELHAIWGESVPTLKQIFNFPDRHKEKTEFSVILSKNRPLSKSSTKVIFAAFKIEFLNM